MYASFRACDHVPHSPGPGGPGGNDVGAGVPSATCAAGATGPWCAAPHPALHAAITATTHTRLLGRIGISNLLSTVSGLVGEDPREARRLIASLADLLRDSLFDSDDMRTLDEEITWLKHYADILETRHRGSLSFRWEIDDAARMLRVPRLLLQPLVENAVRHGALRRPDGGEVAVRAAERAS